MNALRACWAVWRACAQGPRRRPPGSGLARIPSRTQPPRYRSPSQGRRGPVRRGTGSGLAVGTAGRTAFGESRAQVVGHGEDKLSQANARNHVRQQVERGGCHPTAHARGAERARQPTGDQVAWRQRALRIDWVGTHSSSAPAAQGLYLTVAQPAPGIANCSFLPPIETT